MLHIKVIAVGRLKEKFWTDACAEYIKRMKPYAALEVCEIADIDPDTAGGTDRAMEREGQSILRAIPDNAYVVLLAIRAKEFSSEAIAAKLEDFSLSGRTDIVFVIGGSCGVSPAVQERANLKMSFGPITLPHNLARVVLLEQLYRAFKILRGEPYHK